MRPSAQAEPDPRRSDAQRNRAAVLEAAIGLLGERPGASMRAIADASGVGRSTVYRHFPTREELLRALVHRVLEESRALASATAASELPAAETLRGLGPAIVAIGERFRFLDAHRHLREQILAETAARDDPLEPWLAAAQARGELRGDLPVAWMLAMIRGLAVAAVGELRAGRVEVEQAGRLLGETLATAFAAAARAGGPG